MNRRHFLASGFASACAVCGGSVSTTEAKSVSKGCRTAIGGAQDFRNTIKLGLPGGEWRKDPKAMLGGYFTGDAFSFMWDTAQGAWQRFGLRPAICIYDDGGSPNALALPESLFPLDPAKPFRSDGKRLVFDQPDFWRGSDGTILLGRTLLTKMMTVDGSPWSSTYAASFILAHEFGHILQYKKGMTPAGPWQMEPHADFLGGWSIRSDQLEEASPLYADYAQQFERTIEAVLETGDALFNDPSHHGEPELRAAMVRAGFESRNLGLDEAFAKGRKFAGLR